MRDSSPYDKRGQRDSNDGESLSSPKLAPGKRSQTMSVPGSLWHTAAPVQRKPDPAAEDAHARRAGNTERWMDVALRPDVHEAPVQRALANAGDHETQAGARAPEGGTTLPGLGGLQGAFGHHDLSSVSYVGGNRGAAVTEALGTTALASGGLVVSGSDDPAVIAHEAAHVVLQRGGITGGPEAEERADEVASAAVRGQSVEGMLDQVARPGAANSPMSTVDPMKKAGVAVDISTLSPRAVLMALDTVSRYGEPGIAGDTEYEAGDTVALEARRNEPGFGVGEIADLRGLLTGGDAALQAVAAHRHLALALPTFQTIFDRLSGDARVVGINEWAVMNSVYVDMVLANAGHAASGAEQLLDALNELRTLEVILGSMSPTDTLDVREVAIAGTTQTADGTVKDATGTIAKQIEVKTVREPIAYNQLAGVKTQLGAGLTKFAGAGPGDYEVHVFAAYSEAGPVTKPMGPYSRTESINRDAHTFERTSTKPGYDQTTSVRDELLAYLNGSHKGNPTLRVVVIIENTSAGPDTLTFSHPGAHADWT